MNLIEYIIVGFLEILRMCSREFISVFIPFLFKEPKVLLMLIFLSIFPPAGIYTLYYGLHVKKRIILAKTWPKAAGTVITSGLGKITKGTSVVYYPIIEFSYEAGGKAYTSNSVNWGATPQSSSVESIKAYLEPYPVGHKVAVSYNPGKAHDCVVDTDPAKLSKIPFILTAIFIPVGTMLLFIFLNQVSAIMMQQGIWSDKPEIIGLVKLLVKVLSLFGFTPQH